jgi:hypothetical protein
MSERNLALGKVGQSVPIVVTGGSTKRSAWLSIVTALARSGGPLDRIGCCRYSG